ncbi:multidrug transporter [Albitalea terrae]|uniref:Multidrug transporter n=2 Tax=Piscinibacter terrae TaxID=2496871 RepID=A0A3N7HKI7_9BURK|nr:efflux transporter outer membrane subunit [Albitalea terrae]RQP22597.1 multidrug transporter [Albitalea terrae]
MSKRLALSVVMSAALAGCMSLAPKYERPAAPVPERFSGDGTAVSGPVASDLEWQSFFADERLKRLIGIALANNRDLRIAALNMEQARAAADIRRADLWPTVNAGANASRGPSAAAGGAVTSLYTVGLAVTGYELDFFGRVRNLNDAALAQYLATDEARKTAQISLIAQVATTYLNLLADEQLLEATKQTLVSREESLKLTRLKFDNGAASELDFRQAESLHQAARVAFAQQTRQRALDENALVLLLGQGLPADLPAGLPLLDQRMVADLPAGIPSEVLVRRPDVRAAEQALIAANANIGAARAAFFPRITLTGSVGTASSELNGLFKSGSAAWTFAPSLTLPIFDAGRNSANLASAKVGRDIAVAQYERTIQTAFREVSDALAGRATFTEQLQAQQAQTAAEEARYRLADLRYRNGASSYLDVLDAQRALFTAQQALVQTQAQQVQNLVTVYKVLGGGWTPPADTAR